MPGLGLSNRGRRGLELNGRILRTVGASWLEPQSSIVLFDDFIMDVLADDPYVSVVQSGTALTAAVVDGGAGAPVAGLGGWIGGKTDDVDAEIDEVAVGGLSTGAGTPWLTPFRAGDGVMVVEWGFVIPTALTARQYFVGFSDDPTEGTGTNGPVNITGTYATVTPATDAAGFIFSSLATAPTVWKTGSVKNDVDGVVSAATEGVTATVDFYTVCRVEVDSGGNAHFFQAIATSATTDGWKKPQYLHSRNAAVTSTAAVKYLPVFTAAPTTTTGVEWELDYVFAATPR
jgi:hypothetical protein